MTIITTITAFLIFHLCITITSKSIGYKKWENNFNNKRKPSNMDYNFPLFFGNNFFSALSLPFLIRLKRSVEVHVILWLLLPHHFSFVSSSDVRVTAYPNQIHKKNGKYNGIKVHRVSRSRA